MKQGAKDFPAQICPSGNATWKKNVSGSPQILLGGEPIWTGIKKYGKERPASYGGKPMGLILQVAENFNFEK